MSKPKTPMSDLYAGDKWDLDFTVTSCESNTYHGYKYGGGEYHSLCGRDIQSYPLEGAIITWFERDISPVRRPCKLCLVALRKAVKETE